MTTAYERAERRIQQRQRVLNKLRAELGQWSIDPRMREAERGLEAARRAFIDLAAALTSHERES